MPVLRDESLTAQRDSLQAERQAQANLRLQGLGRFRLLELIALLEVEFGHFRATPWSSDDADRKEVSRRKRSQVNITVLKTCKGLFRSFAVGHAPPTAVVC